MRRTDLAERLLSALTSGIGAFLAATVMTLSTAHAEADGPDFLRVTGVREGGSLNVRSGPGLGDPRIGSLHADAGGIRSLGCKGGLTFAEWERASPQEREAGRKLRWCRIEHGALFGWAAGWHLAEGSAPDDPSGRRGRDAGLRTTRRARPARPRACSNSRAAART
jgi:uncharacterized protein YraI